jgi:hypothetical protein
VWHAENEDAAISEDAANFPKRLVEVFDHLVYRLGGCYIEAVIGER